MKILAASLMLLFLVGGIAFVPDHEHDHAHPPEDLALILPPSGFLPSDRFYFLERLGEKFMGWWMARASRKMDYQVKLAAERLSELEQEIEKNGEDSSGVAIAASLFAGHIQEAKSIIAKEKEKEGGGRHRNFASFLEQGLVKIYKENYKKNEVALSRKLKETEQILRVEILVEADDLIWIRQEPKED